jgi:uncharacterized protein (TIGR02271 family)
MLRIDVEKEGNTPMTTTQQLVVGIFRDHAQAEEAIHELLQIGFAHHQIHFATRGTSTGGILEKVKSLFTGQDISAGGIYDDLVKMGAPPEDARYYQSEFEAGRTIVAVQGPGEMQKAIHIMVRHGGYGANQRFAQFAGPGTASTSGTATGPGTATGVQRPTAEEEQRSRLREEELRARKQTSETAAGAQRPTAEEEQRIKLREEELRARKQTVETGEAVLHKDVVVEKKTIDVPVTHEEVYVERRPGSGLPSDQPISEGETYRVPVHEEQVTTEKVPVEREEVTLKKQPVQETQRVTETVQREEAHVEYEGDVDVRDKGPGQGRDSRRGKDVKRGRGFERGGDIEDQTTP